MRYYIEFKTVKCMMNDGDINRSLREAVLQLIGILCCCTLDAKIKQNNIIINIPIYPGFIFLLLIIMTETKLHNFDRN